MNGVKLCFSIANLLRLIDTKQEKTEKRLKGIAKGLKTVLGCMVTKRVTKKAIRHDGTHYSGTHQTKQTNGKPRR